MLHNSAQLGETRSSSCIAAPSQKGNSDGGANESGDGSWRRPRDHKIVEVNFGNKMRYFISWKANKTFTPFDRFTIPTPSYTDLVDKEFYHARTKVRGRRNLGQPKRQRHRPCACKTAFYSTQPRPVSFHAIWKDIEFLYVTSR